MYRYIPIAVLLLTGLLATSSMAEVRGEHTPSPEPDTHGTYGQMGFGGYGGAPHAKPKMVDATYLGVTTERLPAAIRSHVKIAQGLGLIVTHVAPDSPAEKAGLLKHDILHKLDDQLLVNGHQFGVLIRLYEPGDTVTLAVMRAGEQIEVNATLDEHKAPELSLNPPPVLGNLYGHGGYHPPHDTMKPGMGGYGSGGYARSDPMLMQGLRLHAKAGSVRGMPGMNHSNIEVVTPGTLQVVKPKGKFKLKITDNDYTINIESLDQEHLHLKVVDKHGEVLHDGPWKQGQDITESDLPEEVLESINASLSKLEVDPPVQFIVEKVEVAVPTPPTAPAPGTGE